MVPRNPARPGASGTSLRPAAASRSLQPAACPSPFPPGAARPGRGSLVPRGRRRRRAALLPPSPEPSNHPQSPPAGIAGGTEGRAPFGVRTPGVPPVRVGCVSAVPCVRGGQCGSRGLLGRLGDEQAAPQARQAAPRGSGTTVTVGASPAYRGFSNKRDHRAEAPHPETREGKLLAQREVPRSGTIPRVGRGGGCEAASAPACWEPVQAGGGGLLSLPPLRVCGWFLRAGARPGEHRAPRSATPGRANACPAAGRAQDHPNCCAPSRRHPERSAQRWEPAWLPGGRGPAAA